MPRLRPPGHFVDAGGHRLHVLTSSGPAGRPTVVMDAALGGSALSWIFVQRGLEAMAPALSYDRAGMGWSAPGPLPRDLPSQLEDLERLLRAEAQPPYVLVGHSYGALMMRAYAARHPAETAGVLLVDPPALDEWAEPDDAHRARLAAGVRLSRRGALAARCGLAQLAAGLVAIGALRLAAACARLISGGKLRARSDFNFTPATKLPPEFKPAMRRFWSSAHFYEALASQMETLPAACAAVAAAPPLGDTPLIVLSATDTPAAQRAEHIRVASQSRRGQHRSARASGHWIPLEEPELVLAAIGDLLAAAAAC